MPKTKKPRIKTPPPAKLVAEIEDYWIGRVKSGGGPTKGVRYQRAECEFFAGAAAALHVAKKGYQMPMRWYIAAVRGDRIVAKDRFK